MRPAGDFNGFILLRSEDSKLYELQRSDEFIDLTIRATLCLNGFGVMLLMHRWMEALPK